MTCRIVMGRNDPNSTYYDPDPPKAVYLASTITIWSPPAPVGPGARLRTERHCCPVCRGNKYDRHGKPCWRC